MTAISPNDLLYHQLSLRQSRLVTILPGGWNDCLRCYLKPFLIDQEPAAHYKALSYVWGSQTATEAIIVNGHDRNVTVNLACAIRHLRNVEGPIDIWIDALCINQDNPSEKTAQVALMRDIYAGAEDVVVFLGDGMDYRISKAYPSFPLPSPIRFWNDSRDERYLQLFRETSRCKGKIWNAFQAVSLVRVLSEAIHHSESSVIERTGTQSPRSFEMLRRLLNQPWWQRIWVVQEVAISPKVTVRYGNVSAPWEMFVQAAEATKLQRHQLRMEAEYAKVLSLFTHRILDIEMLRTEWKGHNATDLLSLLQRFSDRKATDERDKIYALLGLARQQGLVISDYSVSIRILYTETSISFIKNYQDVSLLSGDLKRKNRQNLASWVPDWSANFEKADRERLALQHIYKAGSNWRIIVFESTEEYWTYVAEQMDLLVKDLREPRREPVIISTQMKAAISKYEAILRGAMYEELVRGRVCELCRQLVGTTGEEGTDHSSPPQIAQLDDLFTFSATFRGRSYRLAELGDSDYNIIKSNYAFDRAASNCLFDIMTSQDKPLYNYQELITESKFIAQVTWRGARLTTWGDVHSSLCTVGEWMKEALPDFELSNRLQSSDELLQRSDLLVFLRTIVGDIYWGNAGLSRIHPEDHRSLVRWFEFCLWPRLVKASLFAQGERLVNTWVDFDDSGWDEKRFDKEMRIATEGRVFFKSDGLKQRQRELQRERALRIRWELAVKLAAEEATELGSGLGLGLGPASMALEDEIHVLPGGQTHFVLRPAQRRRVLLT
ncbi:heterokaryon incompatibility protein-domain-containing protein [Hypoxylon argillaceum]|nr:heterokaryon incompatibility protein-domain-containing protein [Hypoxylon argillaceum]